MANSSLDNAYLKWLSITVAVVGVLILTWGCSSAPDSPSLKSDSLAPIVETATKATPKVTRTVSTPTENSSCNTLQNGSTASADCLDITSTPLTPSKSNAIIQSTDTGSSCPEGCTTQIDGCDIKGNISVAGEKIYHIPGGMFYSRTKIDPANGERWFCTGEEARSNGWRESEK